MGPELLPGRPLCLGCDQPRPSRHGDYEEREQDGRAEGGVVGREDAACATHGEREPGERGTRLRIRVEEAEPAQHEEEIDAALHGEEPGAHDTKVRLRCVEVDVEEDNHRRGHTAQPVDRCKALALTARRHLTPAPRFPASWCPRGARYTSDRPATIPHREGRRRVQSGRPCRKGDPMPWSREIMARPTAWRTACAEVGQGGMPVGARWYDTRCSDTRGYGRRSRGRAPARHEGVSR